MNLKKMAIKPEVNGKRQPFNRVLNNSVIPMVCHTGNLNVLFDLLLETFRPFAIWSRFLSRFKWYSLVTVSYLLNSLGHYSFGEGKNLTSMLQV
jgi:hypothetical protein